LSSSFLSGIGGGADGEDRKCVGEKEGRGRGGRAIDKGGENGLGPNGKAEEGKRKKVGPAYPSLRLAYFNFRFFY